jgi:hypothetical protein
MALMASGLAAWLWSTWRVASTILVGVWIFDAVGVWTSSLPGGERLEGPLQILREVLTG